MSPFRQHLGGSSAKWSQTQYFICAQAGQPYTDHFQMMSEDQIFLRQQRAINFPIRVLELQVAPTVPQWTSIELHVVILVGAKPQAKGQGGKIGGTASKQTQAGVQGRSDLMMCASNRSQRETHLFAS